MQAMPCSFAKEWCVWGAERHFLDKFSTMPWSLWVKNPCFMQTPCDKSPFFQTIWCHHIQHETPWNITRDPWFSYEFYEALLPPGALDRTLVLVQPVVLVPFPVFPRKCCPVTELMVLTSVWQKPVWMGGNPKNRGKTPQNGWWK